MALGTYDRDERKKKVVYNADGTTSEEKADRSVVAAAPVRDEELKANPALSKAMPVTQTPQPQMAQAPQVQVPLSPLERKAVPAGVSNEGNKGATPPQDSVTNQGPQSNVNSGGDIKNNQGEVNQDTGTPLESQVGPASNDGAENMQWAGAPKGDVTSTYNNIINPPQPTPPLNAPVREFGGYNFSTVTPTGNTLSDADMGAYFDMLKKASENTGESIEELDRRAGGLLVGKSQQATAGTENPQQDTAKKNAESTGNGSTGAPTNTNGTNKGTAANNANTAATGTGSTNNGTTTPNSTGTTSANTASTTTAPVVLTSEDYAKFSPSVLQTMAEIERDPMKKAMMQKAMQLQAQGASQPTAVSGATSTAGTAASTEEKKTSALTDEEKKEKENARITLQEKYGSGNVNINKRPVVSEKQMHDKGWGGAVGDQSVYPQIVKIKDDKGNVRNVIMTPILPNGDILSPQEFKEYVQTFEGDDNFLSHDTHGIILKVDASDTDLDELDDLTKKALKGELVTDLDGDLENEYNPDNSPTRKKLVEAQESTQKKINELEALMSDPDKPLTSVALDEATKRLNENDADTEKIKKRKKTAGIIANIGDILQGFANLAGTWYGAKSSDLTSLSAASNAGYERELTKREKRREELSKSIDSIKADLKKNKNTELSEWIKRLDEINKEIRKWDADAEKTFRNDKMKREQMRENTKQQNQRRAVEYAEKRAHAKYLSDLRKEEMGVRYGYSKDLKQTPPGKNPSSNKSNGGNKRGRGKTVDKMK